MLLTTLFLAFSALAASQPHVKSSAVYDGDHRVDVFQVTDPHVLQVADSTLAVFSISNLQPIAGGFSISAEPMSSTMQVCRDEKFASQPTPADCSAVLVSPTTVYTAGHCVTKSTCLETAFVFGYRMTTAEKAKTVFSHSEVYTCRKILARKNTDSVDYAIVQLDRAVQGHSPVPLAQDDVDEGEDVYLLSHPAGTPLKYSAPTPVVRSTTKHFTALIDALGGSSGGPVFSKSRNELVGLLVSGEEDYVEDHARSCKRVNQIRHCSDETGCDGEQVTHISVIRDAADSAEEGLAGL